MSNYLLFPKHFSKWSSNSISNDFKENNVLLEYTLNEKVFGAKSLSPPSWGEFDFGDKFGEAYLYNYYLRFLVD